MTKNQFIEKVMNDGRTEQDKKRIVFDNAMMLLQNAQENYARACEEFAKLGIIMADNSVIEDYDGHKIRMIHHGVDRIAEIWDEPVHYPSFWHNDGMDDDFEAVNVRGVEFYQVKGETA